MSPVSPVSPVSPDQSSQPLPQRLMLMGEGVGSHAERVRLTRLLSQGETPLYAPSHTLNALRESACRLSASDVTDEELERALNRPLSAGALNEELERTQRARVGEPPWTWRLPLCASPRTMLTLGPFRLCFDDSLIGDPWALLIHQGREGGFRVAPPALTLACQGPLEVALLEVVHHERPRLHISLYQLSARTLEPSLTLTRGPWWLTPSAPSERGAPSPFEASP